MKRVILDRPLYSSAYDRRQDPLPARLGPWIMGSGGRLTSRRARMPLADVIDSVALRHVAVPGTSLFHIGNAYQRPHSIE